MYVDPKSKKRATTPKDGSATPKARRVSGASRPYVPPSLRATTKEFTEEREKERAKEAARIEKRREKRLRKRRPRKEKHYTQQDLLEEAKKTEEANKASLREMLVVFAVFSD